MGSCKCVSFPLVLCYYVLVDACVTCGFSYVMCVCRLAMLGFRVFSTAFQSTIVSRCLLFSAASRRVSFALLLFPLSVPFYFLLSIVLVVCFALLLLWTGKSAGQNLLVNQPCCHSEHFVQLFCIVMHLYFAVNFVCYLEFFDF